MAEYIKKDVLKYDMFFVKAFQNNSLDLLIFTAHSESESEASYASVPRRESTDSGNSAKDK